MQIGTLTSLSSLFLNKNRLQTLPVEVRARSYNPLKHKQAVESISVRACACANSLKGMYLN